MMALAFYELVSISKESKMQFRPGICISIKISMYSSSMLKVSWKHCLPVAELAINFMSGKSTKVLQDHIIDTSM